MVTGASLCLHIVSLPWCFYAWIHTVYIQMTILSNEQQKKNTLVLCVGKFGIVILSIMVSLRLHIVSLLCCTVLLVTSASHGVQIHARYYNLSCVFILKIVACIVGCSKSISHHATSDIQTYHYYYNPKGLHTVTNANYAANYLVCSVVSLLFKQLCVAVFCKKNYMTKILSMCVCVCVCVCALSMPRPLGVVPPIILGQVQEACLEHPCLGLQWEDLLIPQIIIR